MYTRKHEYTISLELNLQRFPVDIQDIKFKTWLPKMKDWQRFCLMPVDFEVVKEKIKADQPIEVKSWAMTEMQGFILLDKVIKLEEEPQKTDIMNGRVFHVFVPLQRKYFYWLLKYLLPEFLVTSLTLVSYIVPYADYSNRTALNFSLLLTLFAMNITMSAELPKVPYTTIMDDFHNFCIFSITIFVALQGSLLLLVPEENRTNVNKWFGGGSAVAWVLANIAWALFIFYQYKSNTPQYVKDEKKKRKKEKKDEKNATVNAKNASLSTHTDDLESNSKV
jgi:hypothetical protein